MRYSSCIDFGGDVELNLIQHAPFVNERLDAKLTLVANCRMSNNEGSFFAFLMFSRCKCLHVVKKKQPNTIKNKVETRHACMIEF